jgi:cholesterol 7-dehydrogenase
LGCKVGERHTFYLNYVHKFAHTITSRWAANESLRHQSTVKLTHILKFFSFKFLSIEADIRQVGPAVVILYMNSLFGRMAIIQTITPIEPLVQKMCHYFYAPWYLAWYAKFVFWGETVNVGRDVMIWNSKQFVKNPLLPKEEKQIKLFRNWYSQFYSENSKSFQDAHQTMEW